MWFCPLFHVDGSGPTPNPCTVILACAGVSRDRHPINCCCREAAPTWEPQVLPEPSAWLAVSPSSVVVVLLLPSSCPGLGSCSEKRSWGLVLAGTRQAKRCRMGG